MALIIYPGGGGTNPVDRDTRDLYLHVEIQPYVPMVLTDNWTYLHKVNNAGGIVPSYAAFSLMQPAIFEAYKANPEGNPFTEQLLPLAPDIYAGVPLGVRYPGPF